MIRWASKNDLPQIIELLKTFYKEQHTFSGETIQDEHTLKYLNTFHENDDVVFLVDTYIGKVRGFFLGFMGDSWITPDKSLTEMCLYVHKDYRKSEIGFNLIRSAEEIAREDGCVRFSAGAHAAVDPKKMDQFYWMLGFRKRGAGYSKDLCVNQ